MQNIVIVGASGHAKLVIDMIEKTGQYQIYGLLDSFRPVGTEILGYSVMGTEYDLPQLIMSQDIDGVIVAIGDNFVRAQMVERIQSVCPDLPFITVIHPSANLGKGVLIGQGSTIMAGASVNADALIGDFCIVNTHASLGHDSSLGDFASLAPAVAVGGNVNIGAFSALGIGAIVRHGVSIGEHSVIGAGALVLQNIESQVVAYGSPAKVIRSRLAGDPYL